MAIITRTITNNLSTNLDLFVPGYNTIKPQVVISPSAMVDLFTVLTGDELEAVQNQLVLLVANGSITVNATVDTATFNPVGGGTATTIHADSSPNLTGNVQFVSGANIALTQVGQAITVAATGELSQTLTSSHIFVGNGSNVATDTAMTGDVSITNAGVTSIGTGTVTPAKISTVTTDDFTFPRNVTVTGTTLQVGHTNSGNSLIVVGGSVASTAQLTVQTETGAQGVIQIENAANQGWSFVMQGGASDRLDIVDAQNNIPVITCYQHGGVVLSALTTTAINALTGVAGMVAYDTTLNVLKYFDGTVWQTVATA